jgi:L-aspartate semialdehyde sulfurtransferase
MSVEKTYEEINAKIKRGEAVVVTAEEIIDIVRDKGAAATLKEVDVVTTGTFGPMCSSGAFINVGHPTPRIKIQKAWLNDVPAYGGIAAVDIFIGATELPEDDPLNKVHPGSFKYGGGHVIEDLVAGKDVVLKATGYGTDCYPRKKLETLVKLDDLNEAILMNVRNGYQNYNCAVNVSDKVIYTYMGTLKPKLGNAHYSTAGQLSPLFNDPLYKTIGIGTRIFLGGGEGYVVWNGTQHNPGVARNERGIPKGGAGTLSVIGDLKQMKPEWLVGTSYLGYGSTLTVGLGVPIPLLNEEILEYVTVTDADITTTVIDYSHDYPNNIPNPLAQVTYAELKSGEIEVMGKKVPTASVSSYYKARQIAELLKAKITAGKFELGEPVELLPGPDEAPPFKPLKERTVDNG